MSIERILPGLFFLITGLMLLGVNVPFGALIAGVCAVIIGLLYFFRGL